MNILPVARIVLHRLLNVRAGGCLSRTVQIVHPDLTVAVGTSIVWTNNDSATHTVTLGANGVKDGDDFDSGNMGGGGTFEFTFDTSGSFAYTCKIHPSMNGTIEVTQGS